MRQPSALRKWRIREKLTQAQAAKRIGISQAMLSYLERGQLNPSLRVLRKISKGTGGAVTLESFA